MVIGGARLSATSSLWPHPHPSLCYVGWGLLCHYGSGSTRVPLIIEDTMKVNLVEMLRLDLVDRGFPVPAIGVVSDLGRDFKRRSRG